MTGSSDTLISQQQMAVNTEVGALFGTEVGSQGSTQDTVQEGDPDDTSKHEATQSSQIDGALPEKIAITGARRFLSGLVIQNLASLPNVKEIHVFDLKPPRVPCAKLIFHRIDLVRDGVDHTLADVLEQHQLKCFIHGALFSGPSRRSSVQKEVETIGTFHVLNAIAKAKVTKFLVLSDTFVYGASATNPNFLTEKSPLRANKSTFYKGRVDAERQIAEFMADYPQVVTTVLRFAPILGPNSSNIRARYFLMDVIPKIVGYDPLLQFIHENDAAKAVSKALVASQHGIFNIVGRGVLPLTTAIHMSGKIAVPVLSPLCESMFLFGFVSKIWDFSPDLIPFFKYLCIADGTKALHCLDFSPNFSSRQALRAFLEASRLRKSGFGSPSKGFGEDITPVLDQKFERVF